ncbi:MAG: NADH-quinone oxidoreductase subunit NuoG [Deinococcales bacterium]
MKVIVNDVELDLAPGTSAIDAVFAAGYDVPYFCSHEYMSPIGACRMCLAKVGAPRKNPDGTWVLDEATGQPKIFWFPNPMATCTTAIMEGMVIDSLCAEAKKAQGGMMEMHLINHPLDCPTCDKGGACELQDRAYEYGQGHSRFIFDKRHQEKHHDLSDLVILDRERCIHCKRCVRYFEEVPGDEVLDFIERGGHTYIGTLEGGLPSNFSGNITDICPVGALLDSTSRFRGRNWEYAHTASVSMNDASGSALTIDARTGRIERIKGALNPEVNKIWIDDGSRFGHEYVDHPDRIKSPLIRKGESLSPATWEEAGSYMAEKLKGFKASEIGILFKADSTLEEGIAMQQLAESIGTKQLDYAPRPAAGVIPNAKQATFTDVATSDAILVLGDVTEEMPILDLRIKDALKGVAPSALMPHGVPIADLRLKERMPHKKQILSVAAPYEVSLMREAGRVLRYQAGEERALIRDLAQDLIKQLEEAKNAVIILGGFILADPEATAACYELANRVNAKVLAIGPMANSYGLEAMKLANGDMEAMIQGTAKALIVSNLNPALNAKALKACEFLVAHSLFHNETTALADVVLPAKSVYEKDGTVVNAEGRYLKVQAAPVDGGASEDLLGVIKYLGEALGSRLEGRSLRSARRQFKAAYGLDLDSLPEHGRLVPASQGSTKAKASQKIGKDRALVVPSMVKAEYSAYNQHLRMAFGGPALIMSPEMAKLKGLREGDEVKVRVGGLERSLTLRLNLTLPNDLVLVPALPEQPSGLSSLDSIQSLAPQEPVL